MALRSLAIGGLQLKSKMRRLEVVPGTSEPGVVWGSTMARDNTIKWCEEAGIPVEVSRDKGRILSSYIPDWAYRVVMEINFPVAFRRRVLKELASAEDSRRAEFIALLDLGEHRAALEHIGAVVTGVGDDSDEGFGVSFDGTSALGYQTFPEFQLLYNVLVDAPEHYLGTLRNRCLQVEELRRSGDPKYGRGEE